MPTLYVCTLSNIRRGGRARLGEAVQCVLVTLWPEADDSSPPATGPDTLRSRPAALGLLDLTEPVRRYDPLQGSA